MAEIEENWQTRYSRRRRRLLWLIAVSGFIAAGVWLFLVAQQPEACRDIAYEVASMISQFVCSVDLLEGGPMEKALFIWLWTVPTLLLGGGLLRLYYKVKERMK